MYNKPVRIISTKQFLEIYGQADPRELPIAPEAIHSFFFPLSTSYVRRLTPQEIQWYKERDIIKNCTLQQLLTRLHGGRNAR